MAGARVEKKLTALRVKSLNTPGKYEDGGGLRLVVDPGGSKRWVVRVTVAGQRLERGLGGFPQVSLEQARLKATEIKNAAANDIDLRAVERAETLRGTAFRTVFDISFAQRQKQLSNAKHLQQWRSTMDAYVFPKIGDMLIAEIKTADILDVLTPIWFDKPETAKRVLQRMETVFKSAIVRGLRERASPCIGVAAELGTKHRGVKHHASLPWQDVPVFLAELRALGGRRSPLTVLALEFLILTASRSGETRGALWSELDLDAAVWTIPKERMKARQLHRVPLSPRVIAVLHGARALKPNSLLVFEAARSDKMLSDMTLTKVLRDMELDATPHGFRSSFKVWAAEVAHAQHEVSEAALAHTNPSKVVAAYLRTDFYQERIALMAQWAAHCAGAAA
jgi:integrase